MDLWTARNQRLDLFDHDKQANCGSCNKSRGLGDTVSKAIQAISGGRIKECGGCKKRKETLNRVFSYRNNK
tara:strand:- start:158 stop:370 length:213 start_codon:yes stop_codon:yes gene_type:complete